MKDIRANVANLVRPVKFTYDSDDYMMGFREVTDEYLKVAIVDRYGSIVWLSDLTFTVSDVTKFLPFEVKRAFKPEYVAFIKYTKAWDEDDGITFD